MATNKQSDSTDLSAKADEAVSKLQDKIHDAGDQAASALGRVAGQAEDIARRTLDRARETSTQVRERIGRAGDATVGYIKDEPVKAVMIAAATGAVTALVLSWLSRSRSNRY
ncbi:hypothetical protein SNE35_12755 [Paucibacter sp. R3-3]|uniref:DUF883 domain-containing protein n=1 Tax=Roseateles agri TaxID=3098619 RepID=A0ABU5DGH8_9BURK|nr:hypothetical protein [Paucibacter sp. R3-3]MDY0745384.1 hypothetical protein [Paucibacter sp. R3-3]